jgi:methylated-DNA-[protein]-cysteine S-methyltransferase
MAKSSVPETVYYSQFETKDCGEVWFAESKRGLWRVSFGTTKERFMEDLHHDGVGMVKDPKSTAKTQRLLAEYFAGKRRDFPVAIDWTRVNGFTRKALQVCAKIPYGKTLSYGEVAERAGSPGGARAVGQAMGKNPFPIIVPCHRVVASDGTIGGFSGGLHFKRALLELEGADAKPNGRKS